MRTAISQDRTQFDGVRCQHSRLHIIMGETFIEPPGETVLVGHIEDIIELSVGNTIDTRCYQWVKLDITFGLFRLCKPVLPTGDEQCGEDGRLYDCLAIRCLNTNIGEIAYFQRFYKIDTIDVVPAFSQFFLQFVERELYTSSIIEIDTFEAITRNFS